MLANSHNTPIAQFKSFSIFEDMSDEELETAVNCAYQNKVEQGHTIFHQGEPSDHVYLVVEGQLRLTQLTQKGRQVVLHTASPGEIAGIVAVLKQIPFPATASAITKCNYLYWEQGTLRELMEQVPQFGFNALHTVTNRFTELQNRYQELATERVERRIARTLLRIAQKSGQNTPVGLHLNTPLSRQTLAEMSGTTLFTVSRTCSNWEAQNIIKPGRKKFTILNLTALTAIAEDQIN